MTHQLDLRDPEIARLREARDIAVDKLEEVAEELFLSEKEVRRQRRVIANLRKEIDKRDQADPLAQSVERLFKYWVFACKKDPERTKLGPKRFKAVLARLKDGYTEEDIHQAIEGAAKNAYVNDDGVRFDDLELICRDETKLERFKARAQEAPKNSAHAPKRERRFPDLSPIDAFAQAIRLSNLTHTPYQNGTGMAQCPAHEDRSPSLSFREGSDGKLIFRCFAGCKSYDILKALGLDWPDVFPEKS